MFAQIGLGDIDAAIDFAISAAMRGTVTYLSTPDHDPIRLHPGTRRSCAC